MAVRYAVANGAWSSGSIWDNGAVPADNDDVYANGYVITINQNINVFRITSQPNPVYLPDMSIPAMTSNITPSGVAFASTSASNATAPWKVFDQNINSNWQSGIPNTAIIGYQFPLGKIIKQYAFLTVDNSLYNPKDWTFQGSNDGISYTTLETVTGFVSTINTWYIRNVSANTTAYTYYRMNITAVQTVNQSILIRKLSMTESTGSIYATRTSGSFISTNNLQISASAQAANGAYGIHPHTGSAAFFIITGSHFVGITGSIAGIQGNIPGLNNRHGTVITNGGTASIIGDVYGASAGGASSLLYGLYIITGSAFITGNLRVPNNAGNTTSYPLAIHWGTASISGTLLSATNTAPIGILAGNALVNFTGNAIVNGTSTGFMQIQQNAGNNLGTINYNGPVIGNNNAGIGLQGGPMTVNITGSISSVGIASGLFSSVASTINVSGSITAGTAAPGLQSTSTAATLRVTGPLISNNNFNAVYSPKIQVISNSTPYYEFQSDSYNNKDIVFYDAAYTSSLPAQSNVRSGSVYGGTNEFSGSMIVPSASDVRYGVPVNNTTGSATITPQDIFDFAVQNLTGSNTIGERVKNIATTQTTAATIAAYKGK